MIGLPERDILEQVVNEWPPVHLRKCMHVTVYLRPTWRQAKEAGHTAVLNFSDYYRYEKDYTVHLRLNRMRL